MNLGRNAPCPCGSGKKYKQCCGKPESGLPLQSRPQNTPIAAPGSRVQDAPPADEIGRLVALYSAGRHAELENRARLLVERYPGSGLGWKLLSASLLMQGKDALLALQSAAKFLPGEAELHNNLGDALWKQGRGSEAEASFRRALQIKPDYADAHYNLSRTLLEQGRLDEAEDSLRRALKIKPDFVDALNNLCSSLIKQGKLVEAEASLRRVLEIKPDYAEAHCTLGNILMEQERFAEAEASLRCALEIKPDFAEAHCNLGNSLMKQDRTGEAEASLRCALEIKPDFAEAHCNLGNSLMKQGRTGEAEASLRRALEVKPGFAKALSNLGSVLTEQGRFTEAEASLRRALEIKPGFAEAHCNLSNALMHQNRFIESEASLMQALKIKPDFADAHNNFGILQSKQGKLDEAIASYCKALLLNPDYSDVYGNMGVAYRSQGNLNKALACFQQQVRLTPGNDAAQHHIASLTGSNTERAPIQYVESLFDDYADKFDTHLQQALKYEAPQKLVSFVTQHLASPAEKWSILDLGCGTGLVGSAVAPFARQMVGVDLSERMLKKAHARNLYQRLERSDLLTMMRGELASSYDAIFAADVFVYLGKLDEIIGEIKRLLCPGGVFAFSIETLEELSNEETSQGIQQGYQLKNTGRYAHSFSYITGLAAANGFLTKEMVAAQIRLDYGKPVNGYLVLWKN